MKAVKGKKGQMEGRLLSMGRIRVLMEDLQKKSKSNTKKKWLDFNQKQIERKQFVS